MLRGSCLFLLLVSLSFGLPCRGDDGLRGRLEKALARSVRSALQRRLTPEEAEELGPRLLSSIRRLERSAPGEALALLHAETAVAFAFAFREREEPEEAAALYREAQAAALRVLESRLKRRLSPLLAGEVKGLAEVSRSWGRAEGALVFWWAFSLGLEIELGRTSRLLLKLPHARFLLRWVLARDESIFEGGPHLALGLLESLTVNGAGGDLGRAAAHFDAVERLTEGRWLLVHVIRARSASVMMQRAGSRATLAECRAAQRRAWRDFHERLKRAVSAPEDVWPERGLYNAIARRRAEAMLAEAEDWILPPVDGGEGGEG